MTAECAQYMQPIHADNAAKKWDPEVFVYGKTVAEFYDFFIGRLLQKVGVSKTATQ